MTIPNQSFNILANGLSFAQENGSKNILVIGPNATNEIGEIQQITSPISAKSKYGYSSLAEAAGLISSSAPGSTYAIGMTYTVTALDDAAMTKSNSGSPSVTISGTPFSDYDVRIKIQSASSFAFSLDNGLSYSQDRSLVTATDISINNSGLTVNFPVGTYVAGDYYTLHVASKKIVTTDLDDIFALIDESPVLFGLVVVYDGVRSVADSTSLFSAVSAAISTSANNKTFLRAIIDFGSADSTKSTAITALSTLVDDRISCVNDKSLVYSSLAREGYTYPALGLILPYAARAAKSLISEDPGQVNKGPLQNLYAIENDQRLSPNGLDTAKVVTPMSYKGRSGFYITNSWLKSAEGSDYRYLQLGRVMDTACTIISIYQPELLKRPLRTISGGYIDPVNAVEMEKFIEGQLKTALLEPVNSGDFRGHVSNLAYQITRTNNVLSDETIYATCYIRPLGYANTISVTIGFSTK